VMPNDHMSAEELYLHDSSRAEVFSVILTRA
jgi:hypothetical protein